MRLTTKAARESPPTTGGVCSSIAERRRGRRSEERSCDSRELERLGAWRGGASRGDGEGADGWVQRDVVAVFQDEQNRNGWVLAVMQQQVTTADAAGAARRQADRWRPRGSPSGVLGLVSVVSRTTREVGVVFRTTREDKVVSRTTRETHN
ncbi:hypothetical protein Scep_027746 [Stephania cephalantha]|uniref:Uncharacterized protein n=1 Tax=Stephania cephalantha TaxID=152367 RepID=A0AAP0HIT4_9MAGN